MVSKQVWSALLLTVVVSCVTSCVYNGAEKKDGEEWVSVEIQNLITSESLKFLKIRLL